MRRTGDIAAPLILLAVLLAIWEASCILMKVPTYFLPRPSEVVLAGISAFPLLMTSAWNTLAMALQALVIASLIACSIALIVSMHQFAEKAVRPFAVVLQVTPVVAIAPQVVIWATLQHPERAVIALATIVAFFPIFSGALTGLKSADRDLERLFDLYGASTWQRLRRLWIPSALPYVLEGHKVAVGLSLVGAVVAEFVAGSGGAQGLAWRILESSNRLMTARTFAALVILGILGALLFAGMSYLEKAILRRLRGR